MSEILKVESIRDACISSADARGCPIETEALLEIMARPASSAIGTGWKVPGPWGLIPLMTFAARIARGESWPEEVGIREPPDLFHLAEYSDEFQNSREGARFWNLLCRSADGVYLPFSNYDVPLEADSLVVGSTKGLLEECLDLARVLEVSDDSLPVLDQLTSDDFAENLESGSRYRWEKLGLITLWRACREAVEKGLAIGTQWQYEEWPGTLLTYFSASYLGLGEFEECSIAEGGRQLDIKFPSGRMYRVPAAYLIHWKSRDERAGDGSEPLLAEVCRQKPAWPFKAELVINNSERIDVSAIDVLEWCEPEYSGFGSSAKGTKKNAESWIEEFGSFRVE